MIEVYDYTKRPSYPHMAEKDRQIWERYIDQYPTAFLSVQYDYHVGDGPQFNTLLDDGTDTNQDKLYRLRIDVVAKSATGVCIAEIKPNAGPSSIGQIKSYTTLYKRDEDITSSVDMLIITDKLMPNMDYLCKQEGVRIVVV